MRLHCILDRECCIRMITVALSRAAGARASGGCRGPLGVKIIRPIELFWCLGDVDWPGGPTGASGTAGPIRFLSEGGALPGLGMAHF